MKNVVGNVLITVDIESHLCGAVEWSGVGWGQVE